MASTTMKLAALAREEAQNVTHAHSALFTETPIRASKVAEALGMQVRLTPNLRQRARLDCYDDGKTRTATVLVRKDLDNSVARFALAHEIGHFILLERHADLAAGLDVDARERFSNTFAAELLIPTTSHGLLGDRLRQDFGVRALLALASEFGVTLRMFLITVSRHNLLRGVDGFYLLIKHKANKRTGLEPRLRIESAHLDRERYFVPDNQSIRSFAGNHTDEWLTSLPIGFESSAESVVKYSMKSIVTGRFKARESVAVLSSLRLNPSSHDGAEHFATFVGLAPLQAEVMSRAQL